MDSKYFMHQIKCTKGNYEKGIVVKDDYDGAKQSYHAYLGAYAYGHDKDTNYVQCMITDYVGGIQMQETWIKREEPQLEPEPTPEMDDESVGEPKEDGEE